MKNLVLSLFLIFSFAVQGFGSDIELSIQKADKCFKKVADGSSKECFEDLGLSCFKDNDCSGCLAYIYINLFFKFRDPDNESNYEKMINQILDYKSNICPNLIRDTDMITYYFDKSIEEETKRIIEKYKDYSK